MIDWTHFPAGNSRVSCPSCGRNPRDRTCGVTVDERGGVAHCFRCGLVETTRGERRTPSVQRHVPRRGSHRHETLSDYWQQIWRSCGPISGVARDYLEVRCCVVPPSNGHLRWHPKLRHWPSGYEGPALVALVTNALTGAPMTLHRTWIRADGRKADVDPARMLLGEHRKKGGVVRLWLDEQPASLGVAEGIETALSLAHAHRPVWATLDAGNLSALAVLQPVRELLIAADHDEAGIAAANACARRWTSAGRAVRIAMPPDPKTDFNDVARAAA